MNNTSRRKPRYDYREQGTRDVPNKDLKTLIFENLRVLLCAVLGLIIIVILAICLFLYEEHRALMIDILKSIVMILIGYICAKSTK